MQSNTPPKRPKYGGRKPGSPMKRTARAREIAEQMGFHPVEVMIYCVQKGKMLNEDGTTTELTVGERLDMLKTVAQYLEPKLAQTQHTGKDDGPIQTQALPTAQIMKDPKLADALGDLALMMAQQEPPDKQVN